MTRVVLVHGWTVMPHWFPWLEAKLTDCGHTVVMPLLPNPLNPVLDEWLTVLHKAAPVKDTIFVSHSLGSSAVAQLLQSSPDTARAWIAVAPLVLPRYTLFPTFFEQPIDGTVVRQHVREIVTFHDPADRWAPFSNSVFLREACEAKLIETRGKNHFTYLDRLLAAPEVLEAILLLEKKK